MAIVKRLIKGSPLTAAEHDGNIDELLKFGNYNYSSFFGSITLLNTHRYLESLGGMAASYLTIPAGLRVQEYEVICSHSGSFSISAGSGVTITVVNNANSSSLGATISEGHSAKLIHKGSDNYLLIKY